MNRRGFLSLSGLAAFGVAGDLVAARTSKSPAPRPLESLLETTKVPAMAAAGVVEGKPFQHAGGVREAGGEDRVTVDTIFPAASLSKPVFAWVVRDLVKEGKLEWNKPLTDYTDLGLTGDARRITAEHVLTHSTGLTNWRFQADRPLTAGFAPGSRWQYSGEGIFLLQRVVEKIVAVPIAATMKSRVLQPLGMTASTFGWTPDVASRSAAGHDRDGSPLERSLGFYARKNYDVLEKAGLQPESATYDQIVDAYQKAKAVALPITMSPNMAGSLQTTAVDYAKFVRRVLAEITQHPDDFRSRIDVNRHIAWARGWGIDRSLGTESLFHWGDGPGFKNFTWVEPARKTALVFFTNGDHGASLYAWAFHDLLREDPAAFYWI